MTKYPLILTRNLKIIFGTHKGGGVFCPEFEIIWRTVINVRGTGTPVPDYWYSVPGMGLWPSVSSTDVAPGPALYLLSSERI